MFRVSEASGMWPPLRWMDKGFKMDFVQKRLVTEGRLAYRVEPQPGPQLKVGWVLHAML